MGGENNGPEEEWLQPGAGLNGTNGIRQCIARRGMHEMLRPCSHKMCALRFMTFTAIQLLCLLDVLKALINRQPCLTLFLFAVANLLPTLQRNKEHGIRASCRSRSFVSPSGRFASGY